ncbi:PREDICTED: uncharacterized protein LOC104707187 [Camelina sativa]|uniref:Uncharacterized protein LOC104707187 n=1 Tax=Camelina sativa TaxID=90675 RepID=A0ABM0T6W5_CAMSA|nr:PREDICTED: uncharacterized protein LOC104707187 [Camelina sativa]XP_010421786.1 PREDICTED: uncharacterized protein LOC104707187 [Camelina sativa]XP_010421787.1 PREDICTED: uncharacterized protein LOC104707187 [Camelina sativa]XP_019084025.1 PREDICTED: uncharacterized protein LOC104707187 [Camelina sativa]
MTSGDYLPLIEKIRMRIASWTARMLSFAGRLQLISSVLFSLTNFWISAFRLPKACIKEIDRLCSAFLWSGPSLNTKKAKVAWSEVCLPKSEGGLGLRSLEEANKRRRRHRFPLFVAIEEAIQKQQLSRSDDVYDIPLWKGKNDCYRKSFSTKDTWFHIHATHPQLPDYKAIWFTHATPKYAFLLWLVVKNRVATGDKLQQWNPQAIASCILCNHLQETTEHLFFQCSYSKLVWEGLIQKLLADNYTSHWREVITLLTGNALDKSQKFILGYAFQAAIHSLWRERNGRRHGESSLTPEHLIKLIDKNVRNRLSTLPGGQDKLIQIWFAARFY